MSEVQKLMTEVLEQHYLRAETNRIGYCGQECDWSGQFGDHPKHLAAEIDKALGGLTREWGSQMVGDDEVTVGSEGTARYCAQQRPGTWKAMSRWASEWNAVSNG